MSETRLDISGMYRLQSILRSASAQYKSTDRVVQPSKASDNNFGQQSSENQNLDHFVSSNQDLFSAISSSPDGVEQLKNNPPQTRSDLTRMLLNMAYKQIESFNSEPKLAGAVKSFPIVAALFVMNNSSAEEALGGRMDWMDIFVSFMTSEDSPLLQNNKDFPLSNITMNKEIVQTKEELSNFREFYNEIGSSAQVDDKSKAALKKMFSSPEVKEKLAVFFKQSPLPEVKQKEIVSDLQNHAPSTTEVQTPHISITA